MVCITAQAKARSHPQMLGAIIKELGRITPSSKAVQQRILVHDLKHYLRVELYTTLLE